MLSRTDAPTNAARLARLRGDAAFWWGYGRQRVNAQWHLRGVQVGRQPTVLGHPQVEATDLVAGDHFKICSTYRRTLISGWGRIRIGDRVFVNSGVVLFSALEIVLGNDVAIANEAYLVDTNSHGVEGRPAVSAPVHIGAGTWVGARAIVLPGVRIGSRAVVAAGAVVTHDVPAETLVAGNPARVVRQLSYPQGVTRAWHDG